MLFLAWEAQTNIKGGSHKTIKKLLDTVWREGEKKVDGGQYLAKSMKSKGKTKKYSAWTEVIWQFCKFVIY